MALDNEIGVVCWFSIMSTDVAKTNDFYSKLANYDITEYEIPDMGKSPIFMNNETGFAGPMPLEADSDLNSHWMTYFSVQDVDEACKQVERLGGSVCCAPFNMPTIGRSAVVSDPAGAVFHLFTPEQKDEKINVMGEEPGQVCWIELVVEDVEPVKAFYAELLDWTIVEMDGVEPESYYICKAGDLEVGGIMKRTTEMPQMPPHWLPFITVTSITESSKMAESLEASLLYGPQAIPNIGSFALYKDPTGAVFYLFEPIEK